LRAELASRLACVGRDDDAIIELDALLNEGYHARGGRQTTRIPGAI
jgi:hypothetical protein